MQRHHIALVAVLCIALATIGLGVASQPASGQSDLSLDGFALNETSHTASDVQAVDLSIPITYSYDAPVDLSHAEFEVSIGDSLNALASVRTETVDIADTTGSGSLNLTVDLTQTHHFALTSFQPTDEPKEVLVAAAIEMRLYGADGSVLTSEYSESAAWITVYPTGEVSITFDATGEVVIEG